MQIAGKVARVITVDDGETKTVTLAIGRPDGVPPYVGAVGLPHGGAVPNCFAALTLTDEAEIARYPRGTAITLTIAPAA